VPASATSYTANAAFGSGTDLGGGQYVVYNGSGTSVDITNLSPSANYSFTVYEYNGTGTMIRYLTTAPLTATAATAAAPSSPATSVNAAIGNGQVTLSWINGNGSGRLVVMKEGSSVTASPVDLSVYPAGAAFKTGSQLALGEYVVYAGSGNSVTVTGLQNKTYSFKIFEYNGTSAPVYNTTTPAGGSVVVSSALPVKWLSFTAKKSTDGVVLNWTTAQEVNNRSFVVERSENGASFYAIATTAGAGNSNAPVHYSYTDRTPVTAKVYYRIKQVDNDGKASYSPVAMIHAVDQEGGISVYPNPVQNQFKIALPQGAQEGWLTVSNSQGRQVISKKIVDGELVNCSSFSSGLYFLVVDAKGKKFQSRIVKQ
ncbi:MAG TPA: T9SS type A sorting domain-containing protein, partial [Flavisolibacter sp.]|nr:T9SS type A sorting domain-containing protein [Flavisolibacter sp.]